VNATDIISPGLLNVLAATLWIQLNDSALSIDSPSILFAPIKCRYHIDQIATQRQLERFFDTVFQQPI
jgi:hypothetical protein